MIESKNYYIIDLNGKTYKIDKEKALYVFAKLENKKIIEMSFCEFEKYLKKYDMYDEVVLSNFSRM